MTFIHEEIDHLMHDYRFCKLAYGCSLSYGIIRVIIQENRCDEGGLPFSWQDTVFKAKGKRMMTEFN